MNANFFSLSILIYYTKVFCFCMILNDYFCLKTITMPQIFNTNTLSIKVLILMFSLSLFSCNNSGSNLKLSKENLNNSKKSTQEIIKEPFLILYEDLILPGSGGLFRGVGFDMSMKEVKKIEIERAKCSETDTEKDNQLIITTDLGLETLDFADIKYTFDKDGLFYIEAESYSITKEKSDFIFNKVKNFYTSSLGEGKIADDGYLEFFGATKKHKYQVALKKIILTEEEEGNESFGMYLLFSIK